MTALQIVLLILAAGGVAFSIYAGTTIVNLNNSGAKHIAEPTRLIIGIVLTVYLLLLFAASMAA